MLVVQGKQFIMFKPFLLSPPSSSLPHRSLLLLILCSCGNPVSAQGCVQASDRAGGGGKRVRKQALLWEH